MLAFRGNNYVNIAEVTRLLQAFTERWHKTGRLIAGSVNDIRYGCNEVVFQTAITVLSVAKSYSNRGGNHRHRQGTKKRWYLYYIDEEGNFRTRRINALEVLYYRGKIVHRYQIVCPKCKGLSIAFVRSLKGDIECPHCRETIELDNLDDEDIDIFYGEDDDA